MKVELLDLKKLVPYARNPRITAHAVDKVAASIKEFGFRQPIVVDSEMVIIAGHTRYQAAQKLGLKKVPVHVAEGLSAEQVKAYRIADNRTGEEAQWDNLNVGGVLLKNNIDAFMIGSELVGLTTYMSSAGVFPAVTQLKSLAATVKTAVGAGVKVAYGGDWSEYHSVNGWYHLDPLWSDSNIDVVAVDCYFPLTPDLPQAQIDYQAVYDGWTQDEGWDYYWDGTRTTKTFYSGATYAWKNIKHWWNSTHTNPDASGTAWTAKMKPVWFSEIGFPSVDGCANQPNVFVDPDSSESFYPRGSRSRVDFLAQRTALDASIDYLNAENALEANFIPRKFVWTWDARPFPFFPDLGSVWADGSNWKTGHWVQGKLGLSSLGQIVADLLKKVGYDNTMYDTSRLTDIVSGFIVSNRQTVRACLEQLASAYFFDMVESDGLLKFIKRGKVSNTTLDFSELVPRDDAIDTFTITRTQELELPRQVDVIYLNRTADYQAGTQSSQRQTVKAVDYATVNLPIVLSDQEAKVVADVTLYNVWVGRVQYQFTVPPKYALLEPTDVITITKDGASYVMRINSTKLVRNGMQELTAIAEDVSSYDFYNPAGTGTPNIQPPTSISATRLEPLDLPAFPTDAVTDAYLRYGVVGLGGDWTGSAVYRSDDGGANYALMQTLTAQATIGAVLNIINGTVRPVIAYSFFILYALVKVMQFSADLPWLLWTAEDQAIFAGIISFYFGQRAMSKLRSGK